MRIVEWLAGGVMIVLATLGAIALKDGVLNDGRTFYVECAPPGSSGEQPDG